MCLCDGGHVVSCCHSLHPVEVDVMACFRYRHATAFRTLKVVSRFELRPVPPPPTHPTAITTLSFHPQSGSLEERRGSQLMAASYVGPSGLKDAPADTPLHIAADDGDADAVRRLLYAGENPNAVNIKGKVRSARVCRGSDVRYPTFDFLFLDKRLVGRRRTR
jgi:hypothetical protein